MYSISVTRECAKRSSIKTGNRVAHKCRSNSTVVRRKLATTGMLTHRYGPAYRTSEKLRCPYSLEKRPTGSWDSSREQRR